MLFEEFTYIILEWLVNTHIKWLNSARYTSWNIKQDCFAIMKPVLYIGCLLGSMHVCIKNFDGGSRSWCIVGSLILIVFNRIFHDCFITLCLSLKGDIHSSIPLFFFCRIYPQPFAMKD